MTSSLRAAGAGLKVGGQEVKSGALSAVKGVLSLFRKGDAAAATEAPKTIDSVEVPIKLVEES